jgi:hypothetical protein
MIVPVALNLIVAAVIIAVIVGAHGVMIIRTVFVGAHGVMIIRAVFVRAVLRTDQRRAQSGHRKRGQGEQ